LGRFISEDPIEFIADINFYRYVFNNSINYIDPSGLFSIYLIWIWYRCAKRVMKTYQFPSGVSDEYKHCVLSCKIFLICGLLQDY